MYSKEVTIHNPSGLHARPAADLVKFCGKFSCAITLTGGRAPIDAKSIFAVLSAAIRPSTVLTITGDGEGEQEAVEAVGAFIEGLEG